MLSALWVVYLILGGLAVLEAVLVLVQTWEHGRFARTRLGQTHRYGSMGRVMLIVPCRGTDLGLQRNLETLFRQDYDDYQVRFVVESTDDPVCPVICRLMDAHPEIEAEIVVAGKSQRSGQKVHNLLAATDDLPEGAKYLAFVDSDARLRHEWLRALVARLDRPEVAAATGYRWFVPDRPSLANHLLYSLNSSIAVFLGKHPPTVVWGGSWAIRRDRFESLGLRAAWDRTIDDDLVAGRVFRRAGLRVIFEPVCMVVSPIDTTFSGLFSFLRRQYFITRFYTGFWWAVILAAATFANLFFWGSLAACLGGLVSGLWPSWIPGSLCALLYALGVVGGVLRHQVAMIYFPRHRRQLLRTRRLEMWGSPLVALANWTGLIGSMLGRGITWRGITYRLDRHGRVQSIRRAESTGVEVSPLSCNPLGKQSPDLLPS